jgi:hypothetical protein
VINLRLNGARWFILLSACTASLVGCGGTYDATVDGVVTLDNSPLTAGTVKFTPKVSGPSGYAFIENDGSYSVMTGRETGLPSGDYTITVVANEPSIPNKNPSLPPTPGKPITPPWYRNPQQSPLAKTVEPGGNEINLELTKQPPAGMKTPGRK